MWKIQKDGFLKLKEIFLFEDVNNLLEISNDGTTLLLFFSNNQTHLVYNALTLELIKKIKLQ